ncbi:MAG: hypothetical protein FWC85_00095 [Elusimicrobia bacterium]|nr:hypothetical protein [Elusimicrobiota bacterium]
MTNILIVTLAKRKETSVPVQEVLTNFGCIIKMRLGLHETYPNACTDKGIIILDVCGKKTEITKFINALKKIKGVKTKLVTV